MGTDKTAANKEYGKFAPLTEEEAVKRYASQYNMGHEDAPIASLPRLLIVSSQMKGASDKDHVLFGITPGEIWFTGNDSFGTSIVIVPCYYHLQYTEYADPKGRGAPCATHATKPAGATWDDGLKKLCLPNHNILRKTGVVYGILTKEGMDTFPVAIFMAGMQFPKWTEWIKQMHGAHASEGGKGIILPPWSRSYTLTTRVEQDGQNSWHGWIITSDAGYLDPANDPAKSALALYPVVKENYQKMVNQRLEIPHSAPMLGDEIPF